MWDEIVTILKAWNGIILWIKLCLIKRFLTKLSSIHCSLFRIKTMKNHDKNKYGTISGHMFWKFDATLTLLSVLLEGFAKIKIWEVTYEHLRTICCPGLPENRRKSCSTSVLAWPIAVCRGLHKAGRKAFNTSSIFIKMSINSENCMSPND